MEADLFPVFFPRISQINEDMGFVYFLKVLKYGKWID